MPKEIEAPREAPGSLADFTLQPWRPVTDAQWKHWHKLRDDAWLALHHAAMVLFDVTPDMWTRGMGSCASDAPSAPERMRMKEAEEWLHEMVVLLGLTPEEEQLWEHRMSCPKELRRQPPLQFRFMQAMPARPGSRIGRRKHMAWKIGDGLVDEILVRQVIERRKPARLLNSNERAVAAGVMAAPPRNYSQTRIAQILGMHNVDVPGLLAEYEEITGEKVSA